MSSGTVSSASRSASDPVLAQAFSEMETEGVNLSDPVTHPDQDDAPASNPAAPSEAHEPEATPLTAPAETDPAEDAPSDPANPSEDEDPLKGAEPFTYTVNDQTKTIDGVHRIPGEGLIVPEDKVQHFQLLASRADTLERQTQEMYQKNRALEALTAWTTKDADGKDVTLTGPQALEAQRVRMARVEAASQELSAYFDQSPAELLKLMTTDEQGNPVWDPSALNNLRTRMQLAALNAERSTQSEFQKLASTPPTPQAPDIERVAPTVVSTYAQQLGVTLSPEATQTLTALVPRFIRATTPEDIAQNPALAKEPLVVDGTFEALVKQLAQAQAKATQATTSQDKAVQHNTAVTDRRTSKVKPAALAPKPSTAPAKVDPTQRTKASRWDDTLEAALSELGVER